MSINFRCKPFVAVSGNLGAKFLVVDDVLSCHEEEIQPCTSLEENCIELDAQTHWNYYVDLRQSYLALKLNLSKVVVTKLTKAKLKKEQKK